MRSSMRWWASAGPILVHPRGGTKDSLILCTNVLTEDVALTATRRAEKAKMTEATISMTYWTL